MNKKLIPVILWILVPIQIYAQSDDSSHIKLLHLLEKDQHYRAKIDSVEKAFGSQSIELNRYLRTLCEKEGINILQVKDILMRHGWSEQINEEEDALAIRSKAIQNDLVTLAKRAQQYYKRHTSLGGGGDSFVGLTADEDGLQKIVNHATNDNGTYAIIEAGTDKQVEILGSWEDVDNHLSIKWEIIVLPESYSLHKIEE